MLKVKEIPKNERPYERLINNGREFLSTDELLAILIKSGYKDSSSKIIATRIISQLKSISELKKIKYEDLIKIKGIGQIYSLPPLLIIKGRSDPFLTIA